MTPYRVVRALPAALAVIAAIVVTTVSACNTAPPPTHFGACPVGQHWKDPSGQPTGWECVR
jgi:hypothetical protein